MFKKIFANENIKEMLRFGICGVIATAVDFVIFGLVIYLISPEAYGNSLINSITADRTQVTSRAVLTGTAAGFFIGVIVNYLLSVSFVYRFTGKSRTAGGIAAFIALSLIGLILNTGLMALAYDVLALNHWLAKVIVTAVVFVYNYISKRFIIFRRAIP